MLLSLLSTCLKVLDLRMALVIKEIVGTLYFFYLLSQLFFLIKVIIP